MVIRRNLIIPGLKYAALILILAVMIFPIGWMGYTSLSTPGADSAGLTLASPVFSPLS